MWRRLAGTLVLCGRLLKTAGEMPALPSTCVPRQISRNNDACIADDFLKVSVNLAGSRVAYQLCVGGAHLTHGSKHRHRRSKSAHGNFFVAHSVEKSARIEGQDAVHCLAVLHA